jgi:ATP-dependent Lon protease
MIVSHDLSTSLEILNSICHSLECTPWNVFRAAVVQFAAKLQQTANALQASAFPTVQVYAWLGVQPPRGVLLYGPPGCGKTALANAIANECAVPFLRISAPEIVSGMSGASLLDPPIRSDANGMQVFIPFCRNLAAEAW